MLCIIQWVKGNHLNPQYLILCICLRSTLQLEYSIRYSKWYCRRTLAPLFTFIFDFLSISCNARIHIMLHAICSHVNMTNSGNLIYKRIFSVLNWILNIFPLTLHIHPSSNGSRSFDSLFYYHFHYITLGLIPCHNHSMLFALVYCDAINWNGN